MTNKSQRIADYITRRVFPDPNAKPATPPARMTFREWSRKTERISFVPKDTTPRLGIVIRLMACVYPWMPIEIEVGEPFSSITPTRALIRFSKPLNDDGALTDACRQYIIDAVQNAVKNDGYMRSITWPEPPSQHHGEEHG